MIVLCVNSGSSSVKLALFRDDERLASSTVEGVGRVPDHGQAVHQALADLEARGFPPPDAAGHRFVHGGPVHHGPRRLDPELLDALRKAVPFAPLHLPAALLGVEAVSARRPGMPQVACFDTDFHWNMPQVVRRLPLPRELDEAGVRRYGFHGLSYESVVAEIGAARLGRAVLAHLGNGASMAAVRDGQCLDTTMAFTPAAGLVMSTRSGDLDPGLVAYFSRSEGMSAEQFDEMVNTQSGLLGISETSPDVRDLFKREKEDARAAEALALFCYQAKKWIGALSAVLGGLDTLVFAGGIGENGGEIRARICDGLGHLGLELDPARNEANAPIVSQAASKAIVRVIRTDEELLIARSVESLLTATEQEIARNSLEARQTADRI